MNTVLIKKICRRSEIKLLKINSSQILISCLFCLRVTRRVEVTTDQSNRKNKKKTPKINCININENMER